MDTLRKPFLIIALAIMTLAVLVEVGATAILPAPGVTDVNLATILPPDKEVQEAYSELDPAQLDALLHQDKPPGMAIRYLALVDGILLFTVALMSASLLIGERIHGRVQGIVTLIFALLLLVAAIGLIFVAITKLALMLALLMAIPFGTIAYLAIYGFFNLGGASAILGLLLLLKLGFAVALVVAQQRFLQNKGLVLMIFTSFLAMIIISFLQGLPPLFLVSITDAIAAIIVAILAVVWAIFLLIGALRAVVRAVRLTA